MSNSDDEKIAIVETATANGWPGFYPLKPFEKILIRSSSISNNASYNIDEYESSMDVFASNDESNPVDEFNPADEIRKRQKQEKPVLDKLKAEKKDELFKKYGPKYANKILNTRTIESFYSSCRDVEQMIKERLIVWYKDGYIGLDEFEEMKEKENFENSVFPPKEPERESVLKYFT